MDAWQRLKKRQAAAALIARTADQRAADARQAADREAARRARRQAKTNRAALMARRKAERMAQRKPTRRNRRPGVLLNLPLFERMDEANAAHLRSIRREVQ